MQNAFGEPQTILLLGGTSDIGLAIVGQLVSPTCRSIVLACRNPDAAKAHVDTLGSDGITVTAVAFDAEAYGTHAGLIADVVAKVGDLDVVVMAFGVLGEQSDYDNDPVAAPRP